jgi:hypothetical protein
MINPTELADRYVARWNEPALAALDRSPAK